VNLPPSHNVLLDRTALTTPRHSAPHATPAYLPYLTAYLLKPRCIDMDCAPHPHHYTTPTYYTALYPCLGSPPSLYHAAPARSPCHAALTLPVPLNGDISSVLPFAFYIHHRFAYTVRPRLRTHWHTRPSLIPQKQTWRKVGRACAAGRGSNMDYNIAKIWTKSYCAYMATRFKACATRLYACDKTLRTDAYARHSVPAFVRGLATRGRR